MADGRVRPRSSSAPRPPAALLLAAAPLRQAANPADLRRLPVTTPAATTSPSPSITALIVRKFSPAASGSTVQAVVHHARAGWPRAAQPPGEVQLTTATGKGQAAEHHHLGRHRARPRATASTRSASSATADEPDLRLRQRRQPRPAPINVAAPPPNVPGSTAIVDRGVRSTLTWAGRARPAARLPGLPVRSARTAPVATSPRHTLGPNQRRFTDTSPPADGGEVTYQVLARRAGPGASSSSSGGRRRRRCRSPETTTTTAQRADGGTDGAPPAGPPTAARRRAPRAVPPAAPRAAGPPADRADDRRARAAAARRAAPPAAVRTGGVERPLDRGQVGVGTKAPRLGTPSQANFPDLATPDDGFDQDLPTTTAPPTGWPTEATRGRPVVGLLRGAAPAAAWPSRWPPGSSSPPGPSTSGSSPGPPGPPGSPRRGRHAAQPTFAAPGTSQHRAEQCKPRRPCRAARCRCRTSVTARTTGSRRAQAHDSMLARVARRWRSAAS